jgi:nitrogenase-stabilizing/protective protein
VNRNAEGVTRMNDLTRSLAQLSSAEEFLDFFGITYQQAVVNVSRLHILKRFYQYLRQETAFGEREEASQRARYRELLTRAYQDFVVSTPAQEKVFKVFQDSAGQQHVSVDSLRRSLDQPQA